MVHKTGRLEGIKEEEMKIVKGLKKEVQEDKAVINKYFQKLPLTLQIILESPRHSVGVREFFPLTAKDDEKLDKAGIRYGMWGIHKKALYLGNIKPLKEGKAIVTVRKVFPQFILNQIG